MDRLHLIRVEVIDLHHQAVGVAEAAHGVAVAVAVDHRGQLAVFVVAVLSERFDRFWGSSQ
ncbi:hypothetical protein [Pseudomonas sp. GLN_2]|uniref:hypothetical protein n=1 Tax=Pseudomonas sp. GLN_2 TaxID=3367180 RepID=UPI00370A3F20